MFFSAHSSILNLKICSQAWHFNSISGPCEKQRNGKVLFLLFIPVGGVCSSNSPGQMYSPCLCFDVELGKNK